jgi:hypothetical protein
MRPSAGWQSVPWLWLSDHSALQATCLLHDSHPWRNVGLEMGFTQLLGRGGFLEAHKPSGHRWLPSKRGTRLAFTEWVQLFLLHCLTSGVHGSLVKVICFLHQQIYTLLHSVMTISSQGASLGQQTQDTQEIYSNPRMGNRRWIFHNGLLKQGRKFHVNSRLLWETADFTNIWKNFISAFFQKAGSPETILPGCLMVLEVL